MRRRPEVCLGPLGDFLSPFGPFGPLDLDLDFEIDDDCLDEELCGVDDEGLDSEERLTEFTEVAEFVVNFEEDERLLELERGGVWVVCCTLLEGYNSLPGSVDVDDIGLRW